MNWVLASFLGALSFTAMSIISKHVMNTGVSPLVTVSYIFGIAFVLLAATAYFRGASVMVEADQIKWVLLMSFASFAGNLFLFTALRDAPNAGYSTAIRSSSIVFVTVFAWVFLNDSITWLKSLGILFTTIGVAIIAV